MKLAAIASGERVEVIREGFGIPIGWIGFVLPTNGLTGGNRYQVVLENTTQAYSLPEYAIRLRPCR